MWWRSCVWVNVYRLKNASILQSRRLVRHLTATASLEKPLTETKNRDRIRTSNGTESRAKELPRRDQRVRLGLMGSNPETGFRALRVGLDEELLQGFGESICSGPAAT